MSIYTSDTTFGTVCYTYLREKTAAAQKLVYVWFLRNFSLFTGKQRVCSIYCTDKLCTS